MIGLDTTILIRYLTQDDVRQAKEAMALLEGLRQDEPALVCDIVLGEWVWVLESAYGYSREQVIEVLERMAEVPVLRFQDSNRVRIALHAYRDGADLSDALIAATDLDAGCKRIFSFDRKAARLEGVEHP